MNRQEDPKGLKMHTWPSYESEELRSVMMMYVRVLDIVFDRIMVPLIFGGSRLGL